MSAAESIPWIPIEPIRAARTIIEAEAAALRQLAERIPAGFDRAVDLLAACDGAVIVTGVGKAGWIGQKVSATLASTGTCSHFLHPTEAMHGDLGRISGRDLVLALSNSGETAELLQLLPALARRGISLVAVTGRATSTLAAAAEVALDYGAQREACPLGLAPTTSTTLMLALGDALALVVSGRKGFGRAEFAHHHPGGSLGRMLATVDEVMRPLPACRVAREDETVRGVYVRLQGPRRRSGAIVLVDDAGRLAGIFTDSDLARLMERQHDASFDRPIAEVMTRQPKTVRSGERLLPAIECLAEYNLSELPVVDEAGRPVGLIDVTDVIGLLPQA